MTDRHLVLIRHAKSSWNDPSLDDINRPLNARGERDAPFMAEQLVARGLTPDILLTSPAMRCTDTADQILPLYPSKAVEYRIEQRLYEASVSDHFDVLRELPDEARTVFLVGHNPGFTAFAIALAGKFTDNVPTNGLVDLAITCSWADIRAGSARLLYYDYPRRYFPKKEDRTPPPMPGSLERPLI